MKMKYHIVLLLAVLTTKVAGGQNDELHIPLESDNQFPPENPAESGDIPIEGSGAGVVEEPVVDSTTELLPAPKIEDIKPSLLSEVETTTVDSDVACPKPCVCHTEGDTNNFVVDCSGYGLTEFPTVIDPRTTTLNLQNNKLTEIPKEVSALKSLQTLNANNNEIMELAPGSISELPELVTLKLANNRLIEYPRDLQNSLILSKLEELDLGGNDMRTKLSPEAFAQFSKSLKKLTLATSTPEFLDELCETFKDTLEEVCTGSCEAHTYDCADSPVHMEDDFIDATLPGMIAYGMETDESDPEVKEPSEEAPVTTEKTTEASKSINTSDQTKTTESSSTESPTTAKSEPVGEFSLRTAVNKEPAEVAKFNSIVENPVPSGEAATTTSAPEVNIGAKTVETKTGGVDKSVIGIIVAGMVIVVAVVTIKKNWSSISKRFGSSPRPPNRTEPTANGNSPEEVPLQDKSPV